MFSNEGHRGDGIRISSGLGNDRNDKHEDPHVAFLTYNEQLQRYSLETPDFASCSWHIVFLYPFVHFDQMTE